MNWLDELYATLDKRATAEQVAAIISRAPASVRFSRAERELLAQAAVSRWRYYSSMPDDFERPPAADGQLAAVRRFFPGHTGPWPSSSDPGPMLALVDDLGAPLGWSAASDWKAGRLRHDALKARGIVRRQYNRRIRALRHLTDKARRMETALAQRRLILIGRSGFACDIQRERFTADADAAMFIAYWTARKNRRRLFSLLGKENPMDRLAEALLARCTDRGADCDWPVIAMVYSGEAALRWLDDRQRGELAGAWSKVMRDTAALLEREWSGWASAAITRRDRMIVRAGMNSSGWNEMAQAYNAARAGWLAATAAISRELIRPCLPGKVMRLMAADLAAWHLGTGGDVDPDTLVWAHLPLPWDVLAGRADCPQHLVEHHCRQAEIDPATRGWTAALAGRKVAEFTPTPELVHGVEISDPAWAAALRRAGVFSGKRAAPDAADLRAFAEEAGVVTGKLPTLEEIAAGHDPAVW